MLGIYLLHINICHHENINKLCKYTIKMQENRFIRFFKKNKNLIPKLKFFFIIIGISMFFLFVLEFSLTLFQEQPNPYIFNEYHPFFVYREDFRETKNYCNTNLENSIIIHMYGGSTMWGIGVDAEDTIPSKLSEILCAKNISVQIKNYGQTGQTNTQLILK